MSALFILASAIAVLSAVAVVVEFNPFHGLLYLVVSLLAVALVFATLGAPFAAALEIIIYAGAIVVLFVFVMMMLNAEPEIAAQERGWLTPLQWLGPGALAGVLLAGLIYTLIAPGAPVGAAVEPQQVGAALYGPYVVGVELASMVLLAGLLAAYHLGRRQ